MKKIFKILTGIAFICTLFFSCKKDNINGDSKNLILGSYITLDSTINTNLDFSVSTATVSIKVAQYGAPIASINIYVATGSNSLDTTTWKLIKNIPYTEGGTTLAVTTAELAAALAPAEISPGSQYALQNEVVTTDGRKFSVSNTPTNFTSLPGYNMAMTWQATAVCAFTAAESAGTYKVVQDDWVDYKPGDIIKVTAGPGANQVNFLGYPSTIIGGGLHQKNTVVDVDPATGAATVAKQATGDYGGTSAEVEGSGFIFSCTGVITLNLTVYYGGTPYGGNKFILQKVE